MKRMIEVYFEDLSEPDRPALVDWVDEDEVAGLIERSLGTGWAVSVGGEVGWRAQLARMENNPDGEG